MWELHKKAEIAVAEAESIVSALEEHNTQIAKHFYREKICGRLYNITIAGSLVKCLPVYG